MEAGAQIFHQLDGIQALLRLAGDFTVGIGQQICVSLVVRSADATAQLVHLR